MCMNKKEKFHNDANYKLYGSVHCAFLGQDSHTSFPGSMLFNIYFRVSYIFYVNEILGIILLCTSNYNFPFCIIFSRYYSSFVINVSDIIRN